MSTKIDLIEDEEIIEEKKAPIMITFTELYSMKQVNLEKLIKKSGEVYLLCKNNAPLRITRATLG